MRSKVPENVRVVINKQRIQRKVKEAARQLWERYQGEPLLLVGVLTGSFVFTSDLARACYEVGFDPEQIQIIFVGTDSGYDKGEVTQGVQLTLGFDKASIAGQHVVFVEDIIDTGLTLDYLLGELDRLEEKPASVLIMALLSKPSRREVNLERYGFLMWIGFEIPNVFVLGYGLDGERIGRHVPYIFVWRKEISKTT